MNNFKEGTSQAESADIPSDVGRQLRRAREIRNLSVQSVSASLHIAPRIIIALEENDFAQFLPVFIKGYLRSYGRLLNLPVEPLIESYNRTIQPEFAAVLTPKQGSKISKSPLVFYLLLAAIILSPLGWVASKAIFPVKEILPPNSGAETSPMPMSPTQNSDGTASEISPGMSKNLSSHDETKRESGQAGDKAGSSTLGEKPIPSMPTVANQFEGQPKSTSSNIQDDKTTRAKPSALASPDQASHPDTQGPDTITVHLKANAWVGIRDHTGRRLVYEEIPAGTDRSFSGQAPFFVVLGNYSPETKIGFNGKPYLPPKSKAGAVLRFTIGQSGPRETGSSTVKTDND